MKKKECPNCGEMVYELLEDYSDNDSENKLFCIDCWSEMLNQIREELDISLDREMDLCDENDKLINIIHTRQRIYLKGRYQGKQLDDLDNIKVPFYFRILKNTKHLYTYACIDGWVESNSWSNKNKSIGVFSTGNEVCIRNGDGSLWLGPKKTLKAQDLADRFKTCFYLWKKETSNKKSNVLEIFLNKHYQEIIEIGSEVLPYIFNELRKEEQGEFMYWYWALKSLTNSDPVPFYLRGDLESMREIWLDWADRQKHTERIFKKRYQRYMEDDYE